MKRGEFESYVEQHLEVGARNGDEFMCSCPFHEDRNPSFNINVRKGIWICFSCGRRGNMKKLQRELGTNENLSDGRAASVRTRIESLREKSIESANVYPTSWLSQFDQPTDYWTKRGFDEEMIQQWRLGYDALRDAATIPLWTLDGEVIGVIRRFLAPWAKPKYLYPKHFQRNRHLHGAHLAAKMRPSRLAVVEGSIDAMSMWQAGVPAVALLGNSISDQQARTIRAMGVRTVVALLDNDAGGIGKPARGREEAQGIFRIKDKLPGIMVECGTEWGSSKDPNDLSVPKRLALFRNTVPFAQWESVVREVLGL